MKTANQVTLRGLPPSLAPSEAEASLLNQTIFEVPLSPPYAVIKRTAIRHNAAWMQEFLARYGATLAPHGKTSMSPTVFGWQLADGAKWMSVANVKQARVAQLAGSKRVLIANQIIGEADLAYFVEELNGAGDQEAMCFVDSIKGLRLLKEAARRQQINRPIEVLLEVGVQGGRAGVRHRSEAMQLAEEIAAEPGLALRGLAGYEGVFVPHEEDAILKVDSFLEEMVAIAVECSKRTLFGGPDVILSAGGSKFFDRVSEIFKDVQLDRPVQIQLRCGCYLFHDVGIYNDALVRMRGRNRIVDALGNLQPALEVWGTIQSRPEPTRAIVNIGRRDVSYDAGLPTPQVTFRPGSRSRVAALDGVGMVRLHDQHGYLDVPEDSPLEVGDFVGFGVSHPCTVFDKWNALFVVDGDYRITEIATTQFG